jgi:hypothetical protein
MYPYASIPSSYPSPYNHPPLAKAGSETESYCLRSMWWRRVFPKLLSGSYSQKSPGITPPFFQQAVDLHCTVVLSGIWALGFGLTGLAQCRSVWLHFPVFVLFMSPFVFVTVFRILVFLLIIYRFSFLKFFHFRLNVLHGLLTICPIWTMPWS